MGTSDLTLFPEEMKHVLCICRFTFENENMHVFFSFFYNI